MPWHIYGGGSAGGDAIVGYGQTHYYYDVTGVKRYLYIGYEQIPWETTGSFSTDRIKVTDNQYTYYTSVTYNWVHSAGVYASLFIYDVPKRLQPGETKQIGPIYQYIAPQYTYVAPKYYNQLQYRYQMA